MHRTIPPALAAGLLLGLAQGAAAQDDARAIIEKAIKAQGGEQRLARLKAVRDQAKGTLFVAGMAVPFTGETLVQLPGQFKNVIRAEVGNMKLTVTQVFDGDKGWVNNNGQTSALEGAMLDNVKEMVYAFNLSLLTPLLSDKSLTLTALGEGKVNSLAAVGVKVSSKGHRDVRLYFDKGSGLLIKREYEALDAQGVKHVPHEEYYSDFKDYDGILRPRKVVVFQDGKKFLEGEVTDVKYPDKVDAAEFAKP
jgi:hypothetical protein